MEFSENLTTFVTECTFVGYTMKGRGGKLNNSIFGSYLIYCLLRAAKLNLDKFDTGVVLWVTHI